MKASTHWPLVSLGIPTYNRIHLTCQSLDSLLSQSYEKY